MECGMSSVKSVTVVEYVSTGTWEICVRRVKTLRYACMIEEKCDVHCAEKMV